MAVASGTCRGGTGAAKEFKKNKSGLFKGEAPRRKNPTFRNFPLLRWKRGKIYDSPSLSGEEREGKEAEKGVENGEKGAQPAPRRAGFQATGAGAGSSRSWKSLRDGGTQGRAVGEAQTGTGERGQESTAATTTLTVRHRGHPRAPAPLHRPRAPPKAAAAKPVAPLQAPAAHPEPGPGTVPRTGEGVPREPPCSQERGTPAEQDTAVRLINFQLISSAWSW